MPDSDNASKIMKFLEGYHWEGALPEAYKDDGSNFKGVTRVNLIGTRGESTKFHLRYFEVAPGGYTTYEKHRHEHVVFVIRGAGIFRAQDQRLQLKEGDIAYVRPNDAHQFANEGDQPFGFLCIVDADRDRPVPLEGGGDSSCFGPEIIKIIEELDEE